MRKPIDKADRPATRHLVSYDGQERLVCPLDHTICDTKCPSCRGDYALKQRPGGRPEEERAEERRGRR